MWYVAFAVCVGFAAFGAGPANAACMDNLLRLTKPTPSSSPTQPVPRVHVVPAAYRTDSVRPGSIQRIDFRDDGDEPIVGLWEFQVEGFPPDFGTQAWHSDGTELMFSAGRDPATGDVCQGVWRRIGPRTYSLNHIAMGWDPGTFGVRVRIHAVVTVDRSGNTYAGTLTATAYAVSPSNPFDESVMVGSGSGNITGTRVKPD
jgi:hypothetical protein